MAMKREAERGRGHGGRRAAGIRCGRCGGLNPAGAQWCGQCLERFPTDAGDARSGDAAPAEGPVGTPAPAGTAGGQELADEPARAPFSVSEAGITWMCRLCDTPNPLEASLCSVCGAPFATMLRTPEPATPRRDAGTAALLSLFMPGAGHAYLKRWGQAIARAVVSTWVVLVALFAATQERSELRIVGALFGVIAFALWLVAAHDAYREASGHRGAVVLRDRHFLYLVLGLLGLLVAVVFVTALRAPSS